jgi:hypothetical protein
LIPFKNIVYFELPGERELQESPKSYCFLHGDFKVNRDTINRQGYMNLLENFMLALCFSHCATSGMVAGLIPDGVIGFYF